MTYTTHAVSKLTGLSSSQIRYRIQNGEIKARKYKGRYRISEPELKKLMRKKKRKYTKKRTSKRRSSTKRKTTTKKTVSITQVKKAVQKASNKNDVLTQLENIKKKARKRTSNRRRSGDLYLISPKGNIVKKFDKDDANEFLMKTSGKKARKRKW